MNRRTYGGVAVMTLLSGCSALTEYSADEIGQSYTTDAGVELTVDQVETQSGGRIAFGDRTPISGQSENITFILTHIVATNTTDSALALPSVQSFSLMVGGIRHDTYQQRYPELLNGVSSPITEPVAGPLYPPAPEIGPDEQGEGWLIFTIPGDESAAALELRIGDEMVKDWSFSV